MKINKNLWTQLIKETLAIVTDSGGVFEGSGARVYFSSSFNEAMAKAEEYSIFRFLMELESCFRIACLIYEVPQAEEKFKAVFDELLERIKRRMIKEIMAMIGDQEFRKKREEFLQQRLSAVGKKLREAKKDIERFVVKHS
jgi:hypothetical protein